MSAEGYITIGFPITLPDGKKPGAAMRLIQNGYRRGRISVEQLIEFANDELQVDFSVVNE